MAEQKSMNRAQFLLDYAQKMLKDPSMMFSSFLIVVVLMLIIPLPTILLDMLMVLSITISLLVILTVSYIKKAIEFSIFPTVLLVSTLFRLGVNVSSTRLILTQGSQFDGKMVRAFGSFVVGSSDASGLVVGVIIFIILTIVQVIVITRGATRISEVNARFTLDAMPNKFLAIEYDQNNGIIDENEAIRRRNEVQEESSFYGSMDGASKFVQGDVIVGIIITVVNIIGGFTIGMVMRNESLNLAVSNYILLTVGDGLVSQIPSLLISTATGLIVSRSQVKDSIGDSVWKQIKNQYNVFFISGVVLLFMALLPGFPKIVLILLGAGMIALGYLMKKNETRKIEADAKGSEKKEEAKGPENVMSLLKVDPLSLYIGYELIPLVDKTKGAELLNSVTNIRRTLAKDLGIIVPPIRIQDNMRLGGGQYEFQFRNQEIGKWNIKTGCLLAMGEGSQPIDGEKTTEPAFGVPAVWINQSAREKAESLGYTVVDAPTIISTHIQEMIKSNAHEILGREELKQIFDNVKADFPGLVEDVLKGDGFSMSNIHKLLQNLLKEGVPVRDMVTILETLTNSNPNTPVADMVEIVRSSLKRVVSQKFMDENKRMYILRFEPKIENEIYKNISRDNDGFPVMRLNPDLLHRIQKATRDKVTDMANQGHPMVIVTQPPVRRAVWEIVKHIDRQIAVLSTRELMPECEVNMFGQILVEEKKTVNA